MARGKRLLIVIFGVGVFVGLSLLLALGLTAANRERSLVHELLRAEARGDASAMLAQLDACRGIPACADGVKRLAKSAKAPGRVQILRYDASAQLVLAERNGVGRVAWRAGTGLSVVQCVRVRRRGPLAAAKVELLSITPPIDRQGSC